MFSVSSISLTIFLVLTTKVHVYVNPNFPPSLLCCTQVFLFLLFCKIVYLVLSYFVIVFTVQFSVINFVFNFLFPGIVSYCGHDGPRLWDDWWDSALLYGICWCSKVIFGKFLEYHVKFNYKIFDNEKN